MQPADIVMLRPQALKDSLILSRFHLRLAAQDPKVAALGVAYDRIW